MTLHQFPRPESIAGSGKGTQFPGSLSYFPVLCSVLGAAVIKTTMPALKVCTFLVTPVLLSLFQGRGFPVTGQTFSPLQPTRSLFGFPCYAPSLSLFRPSPQHPLIPTGEILGSRYMANSATSCCLWASRQARSIMLQGSSRRTWTVSVLKREELKPMGHSLVKTCGSEGIPAWWSRACSMVQ